jgi:hypothetical protein
MMKVGWFGGDLVAEFRPACFFSAAIMHISNPPSIAADVDYI